MDLEAIWSCLAPGEILAKTDVDAGDGGAIFGVVHLLGGVAEESSSLKSTESVFGRKPKILFC